MTAPLAGRTILVTGSSGFIGRPRCRTLADAGAAVRAAVPRPGSLPAQGIEPVLVPDPLDRAALLRAVQGADTIVHLATRVHVISHAAADPLPEHRRTNVAGTEAVLNVASMAGVGSPRRAKSHCASSRPIPTWDGSPLTFGAARASASICAAAIPACWCS